MRGVTIFLFAALVLLISSCAKDPGPFDWLTGKWVQSLGNGTLIEEWQKLDDDFYRGRMYAITGTDTSHLDQMQILKKDSGFIYIFELFKGKQDTFKLDLQTDSTAIFTDGGSPIPNLIRYRLISPKELNIILQGNKKGEPTEETYSMKKIGR